MDRWVTLQVLHLQVNRPIVVIDLLLESIILVNAT